MKVQAYLETQYGCIDASTVPTTCYVDLKQAILKHPFVSGCLGFQVGGCYFLRYSATSLILTYLHLSLLGRVSVMISSELLDQTFQWLS